MQSVLQIGSERGYAPQLLLFTCVRPATPPTVLRPHSGFRGSIEFSSMKLLPSYLSQPCTSLFQDQSHCEVLKTLLFSLQDITFQLPLIGFDLLPEEEDNPDLDVDDVGETVSNEMPTLGIPAQLRLIVRSMFFGLFCSLMPFPLMSSSSSDSFPRWSNGRVL